MSMMNTDRRSAGRILLVEDDEAHARIIERAFERYHVHYTLTIAATLSTANEAMQKTEFHLVITDLRLPDGDGLELLRDRPKFPLLIMTSHGNEQIAVEAMRAGALDYIVKSESSLLQMPRIVERAIQFWQNVIGKEQFQE